MGRPPEDDKPRNAVVILRVLPAEAREWKAAARREGLGLSAWLRQLANRAAERSKTK